MNLQGIPNKGRPESPFSEPSSPTKTTFSNLVTSPSTVSPTPSSSCDPKDDLEIMLLHEDFATLLSAAADLKEIRGHIDFHRDNDDRKKNAATAGGDHQQHPTSSDNDDESEPTASTTNVVVPVFQQIGKSAEHSNQVLTALDRMQKALVVKPSKGSNNNNKGDNARPYAKIPVGRYPVIDSVLEDAIAKLTHEYECCEAWIQKQFPTTQAGGISYKMRERTSLAVKYPKAQTDILMDWMIENREDPFPTEDDLCMLAERTGLTTSQVVNWTTNVRKRNRKAVLDNKKKPHHFIDFLFLVQERENKKEESRRMYAWQHRKSPEQQQQQQQHQQYRSTPSLPDDGGAAVSWPPRNSVLPSHHHPLFNASPAQFNGQQQSSPSSVHQTHQPHHQPPHYQANHQHDHRSSSSHRRSSAHMFNQVDRFMSLPRHSPSSQSYPIDASPPDLAIPDGCISKRIFDEVEDLSASAKQYDDLMGNVKVEEWASDVEGGEGWGSTTAADEHLHGHGQHRKYSYNQHHHGHRHPKQQQLQHPHHHHHAAQLQQQQPPRDIHLMAMDSNDNDDAEDRPRVSSLDFEIEHTGKDIDDFVTKNITTHDDML